MSDELTDLLDTALYQEIASQAFYVAGQSKTDDTSAKILMKELEEEERKHAELLKSIREKGIEKANWHQDEVPNLRISEYLTSSETIEGAGLQDTLIFAMKREQQAVEFYSKMMGIMRDETAKRLCENLAHQELKHKLRLEILYDEIFYGED